ncbi:FAD-dependent pyridine nucleotide-disulfide oxidoreductase [Penicillium chermesinum]|uniref:FAD-dependent pyridine nucleotide-disulfide oxidoreductase n=1 Tax=Penicillium chermesinum TaxID=63820 RepID=A0A9W9NUL2_9EURO|nr:FAD-dependent pyridine nucleotide-disulfide oxidoreductase [Penicillium chermesinum]KAJ5226327.1 FAD-dependent pyridine nucleotide-disulfide oxidoreductase [Penicillium chermesinum]
MASTTVVIIGGSVAGLTAAHPLLAVAGVKVVLINPSPTFFWNIAAPRIVTKPAAFESQQYLLPIKDAFAQYPAESFEFILGTATAINAESKTVSLTLSDSDDTKTIPFDYLLIASGASTPATTGQITGLAIPFKPTNYNNLEEAIQTAQDHIAKAQNIVIGGAGPVGVELAGELAEAAAADGRSVSITLVTATDRVLPMLKESASQAAEKQLQAKRVSIITASRVTDAKANGEGDSKPWAIKLSSGHELTADMYIPTTGCEPNSQFVPPAFLDEDGWVKVDKEMRVLSPENSTPLSIYAAGDITTNSMRLSFKAVEQARAAAANIKSDIEGKTDRKSYDQGRAC